VNDYTRKQIDKYAAMTTAEIILDSYNAALQGLNACLTLVNESYNERAFQAFHEVFEGMTHLGHAYSVVLEALVEEEL
jgi:hypothetical protein